MNLFWHLYKYYPYEFELARREIDALLAPSSVTTIAGGLQLSKPRFPDAAERLVYFASTGPNLLPTTQAKLERVNGNGPNRQSTRYSAHGLHEYKGKFNPQMPKAILNILGVPRGSRVLDPFCGSGTSLVESLHLGMRAVGSDINPLAVFLANAKISSLHVSTDDLRQSIRKVLHSRARYRADSGPRGTYLAAWFDQAVLEEIERVHHALGQIEPTLACILGACASDLLRDYSQQDPMDLRIRRRKSPLPKKPFLDAFAESVERFISRTESARETLKGAGIGKAILLDSRDISLRKLGMRTPFDCAVTSPPYATALPYIDTQRLSLVWLGLTPPSEIQSLEATLVGSRESRGHERKRLAEALENNPAELPDSQIDYCRTLMRALGPSDGFRRKAVPTLLYRYFEGMAASFRGVRSVMRDGAPYVLVIGGNHTVLGGRRFDIDTTAHLSSLAEANGWRTREILPLQTYQRYGYHMHNAVASEMMLILEAK